jgi:hypothetical protein
MSFMHISIVWRGPEKKLDQLRPIFDLAEDWVMYGNSNWIIYTSENLLTWHGRIKAVVNESQDSFVICEVPNKESFIGWCPQYVVDWIEKPRTSYLLSPHS